MALKKGEYLQRMTQGRSAGLLRNFFNKHGNIVEKSMEGGSASATKQCGFCFIIPASRGLNFSSCQDMTAAPTMCLCK